MSSNLFENTRPLDDDEDVDLNRLELNELTESPTIVWEDGMLPIEWLFKKEGRTKLIMYAMQEVADGDPVYHNKSALGDAADTSRHSCHRFIDDLVTLGIYEEMNKPNSHKRYRPNADSHILRALYTANREIEKYGSDPS